MGFEGANDREIAAMKALGAMMDREVIGPMEAIGWGEGTPPRPSEAGQPGPSGGAPTPETTSVPAATTAAAEGVTVKANVPASVEIDWESLKDPATGLYSGKYKTVEEQVRGIGHAVNMAKDALVQKAAAEQESARLRGELASARQTPTAPSPVAVPRSSQQNGASRVAADAANAKLDSVLLSVAENGGILDEDAVNSLKASLREATAYEARAAAEEALLARDGAKSEEDAKWNEVDSYMKSSYPGSEKFADEIGLFVQTNPLISKAVNALVASGDRVSAAEIAWLEYNKARGSEAVQNANAAAQVQEIKLSAADQVRKEAVDAARVDAGITASSASGVHEAASTLPSADEIAAAAAGMRAYGTTPGNAAAARWRELTIGRTLDPRIFGD